MDKNEEDTENANAYIHPIDWEAWAVLDVQNLNKSIIRYFF